MESSNPSNRPRFEAFHLCLCFRRASCSTCACTDPKSAVYWPCIEGLKICKPVSCNPFITFFFVTAYQSFEFAVAASAMLLDGGRSSDRFYVIIFELFKDSA